MDRRAPRRQSVLLIVLLLSALLLAAAGLGGCGGSSGGSGSSSGTTTPEGELTPASSTAGGASAAASPSPRRSPVPVVTSTPTGTMVVTTYFLRNGKLAAAERRVPRASGVAGAAAKALVAGPNTVEKAAGLTTAIPAGTTIRGVSLASGVARVDLSAPFAGNAGASAKQRVAQIVYTVTQFSTVSSVKFSVAGKPLDQLGGVSVKNAQRRANWVSLLPAIFVEKPGVGAALRSPLVSFGSASVYEGTFVIEIRDSKNKLLVRKSVQASASGPERGTFRTSLPFKTTATQGTLTAYWNSPEGSSRKDEVRVPVTFAR